MKSTLRLGTAVLLASIILIILTMSANTAYAETIERSFYRFDTETGIMRVFASVPDGESGGWFQGPADGAVKEIIFEETDEDITIGYYGFDDDAFRNLQKVTFSSSVKSIGDRAFIRVQYKYPDFEIVFAEGLETIGDNVFSENHSHVETLKLPSTLKSVGTGAFNGMTIDHLQLPIGIESIGDFAFEKTNYFDDMIGAYYTCLGGALYNKDVTTLIMYPHIAPTGEYVAPATLKTIGPKALVYTEGLKAVILPEGFTRFEDQSSVVTIPQVSFTIVFPSTLEYMGEGYSFSDVSFRQKYYRGTSEQAALIQGNNSYFSDAGSSKWYMQYEITDITFPEEVTLSVGESVFLPVNVSPAEATTEAAKAGRAMSLANMSWTGYTRDINDYDTIVYKADRNKEGATITALHEGESVIGVHVYGRFRQCKIHVTEGSSGGNTDGDTGGDPKPPAKAPVAGDTIAYGGSSFKILNTKQNTLAYTTAPNKKSVSVPKTIRYQKKTYKVTQINAGAFRKSKATSVTVGANVKTIRKNAFKGSKVKTVTLKTKKLTKASVKGSLKNSKVTRIKVKVGSSKVNKKYIKKYKKIFTKKNAGRKVTVK